MGHRDGQHGKVSLWQDQTVQADCFLTVWRCENQHGGVGVSWDRDPGCVNIEQLWLPDRTKLVSILGWPRKRFLPLTDSFFLIVDGFKGREREAASLKGLAPGRLIRVQWVTHTSEWTTYPGVSGLLNHKWKRCEAGS